jgi:hypothetical protein
MKFRIFVATVVAIMLGLVAVSTMALAAPPDNAAWAPFANADWVNGAGHPGFGLVTSSQSGGNNTYGGIRLKSSAVPTDPNSISALSFDFNANQTGASGGSPRMVVQFSDGGNGQLRPLSWTANTWTHLDGLTGNNWDNNGGTCGYQYATTWQGIVGCHPGSTITGIFVVNDSGWLYPNTGEQVTLDNIMVNTLIATGPGNNN